jgi:hypothetical protein
MLEIENDVPIISKRVARVKDNNVPRNIANVELC